MKVQKLTITFLFGVLIFSCLVQKSNAEEGDVSAQTNENSQTTTTSSESPKSEIDDNLSVQLNEQLKALIDEKVNAGVKSILESMSWSDHIVEAKNKIKKATDIVKSGSSVSQEGGWHGALKNSHLASLDKVHITMDLENDSTILYSNKLGDDLFPEYKYEINQNGEVICNNEKAEDDQQVQNQENIVINEEIPSSVVVQNEETSSQNESQEEEEEEENDQQQEQNEGVVIQKKETEKITEEELEDKRDMAVSYSLYLLSFVIGVLIVVYIYNEVSKQEVLKERKSRKQIDKENFFEFIAGSVDEFPESNYTSSYSYSTQSQQYLKDAGRYMR